MLKEIRDSKEEAEAEEEASGEGVVSPPEWWADVETDIETSADGRSYVSFIPYEVRKLAFLSCLVFSSASRDDDAIEATVTMHLHGLLDPYSIAAMNELALSQIIRKAGLHRIKASAIIGICRAMVKDHGGILPEDPEILSTWSGIGDKILMLLWAEILQQPMGIGTDSHVIRMVDGLGWIFTESTDDDDDIFKRSTARNIQRALQSWVPFQQVEDINKIFGCMGQMFTQTMPLRGQLSKENCESVKDICDAIIQHIHCPKDVSVLFSVLKTIRCHYRREEKPNGKKKYKGSENTFRYAGIGMSIDDN